MTQASGSGWQQAILRSLPLALIALRVLLGSLLLWDALDRHTGKAFVAAFIMGFVSDIVDGMIARRLGVNTAGLRQADSWADVSFYGCVFASVWLIYPEVVLAFRVPLLAVAIAQLTLYGLCWIRFGKFPSYHAYSAKAWGITLCVAIVSLFGFGYAGVSLWLAIAAGLLNSLEEIAITLVLPTWSYDVLSLIHAWRSRQAALD